MSTDIGELVARIGGDTSGLSKALSDSKSMINQASTSIGSSIKNLVSDIFSWKTAIGILAGETGLGLLIKKGLQAADSIAKIADAIGVSTDKIQEFHHIGTVAEITIGTMDQALRYFIRNVGELKNGTGDLITRLQGTNETLLSQLKYSKSSSEALDLYFKAMARATTQTERMNLASAGFSREGMKFVNVVRGGEEALNALKEQAYKLGLVVDESLIRKSEEAYTKVRVLGEVIKSKLVIAIGEAAPQISNFIDQIQNGLEKLSKWISSNKDSFDFGSIIKNGVIAATNVISALTPLLVELSGDLGKIALAMGSIVERSFKYKSQMNLNSLQKEKPEIERAISSLERQDWGESGESQRMNKILDLRKRLEEIKSQIPVESKMIGVSDSNLESIHLLNEYIKEAQVNTPKLVGSLRSFRDSIQNFTSANNDYVQTFKDMKAAGYDYGNSLTDSIMTFKGFKSTLNDSIDAFYDFGKEFKNTNSNANETKKRIKETAKALEEVNDIIAKNTLTDYGYEVFKLDEKYKKLAESIGGTNKQLERAYALELAGLKTGIGEEYWKNVGEVNKISEKIIADDNKIIEEKNKLLSELNKISDKIVDDEEKREKDLLGKQIDAISKRILAEDEAAEKIKEQWEGISDSIGSSFTDALVNSLDDGLKAFDNFGKHVRDLFIRLWADKAITQPLIMPAVNYMSGMFGFGAQGTAGAGTQSAMAMVAPYLGAGALGYGMGGIGGGIGAMAGQAIAGPVGALIIGYVGSLISKVSESAPKIPSFDLLWETIDGQIISVTETWKNMGKDQRVFDAAQEFVQSQVDFFKMLSTVAGGEKPIDFTFSLAGTGVDIQKILEQTKAQAMMQSAIGASSQMSEVFGPGFNTQLKDLFVSSLSEQLGSFTFGQDKELLNKYLEWKFAQFSSMPSDQAQQAYDKWMKEQALFSSIGRSGIQANSILDLFQARNPGVKIDESNFAQLEEFGQKTSKGWFNRGEIAFNDPTIQKEWQDFFTDINQQINDLFTTVTSGMGQAFVDSLGTGEYQTFEQSFKKSILAGVQQGLIQGFADQELIPIIFKPFYGTENRPGLTESMKQYQSGEMTLDQFFGNLDIMFGDLNTTLDDFAPIWEKLNTGFQDLSSSLGINTEAVINSTKSYSDNIDNFIANLSGGSLAPSQSMAGIMGRYNELYTAALYDPSKSQDLLNYVGSDYLSTLQDTSSNYAGDYAGTMSQLEGLKTAWGMPSFDVASSINPADYTMPTVAGQTQGIGFKQAMKEALQEVAMEKFAQWFLDLKTATEAPKTVSGDLNLKGSIGSLMIASIKTEPDVKNVVHNA